MSKTTIVVDKFLIYDPDKSQSTGNVYISHPTPVEEDTFGKLLIITDIHSQDRINQDIINTIQEEVKKHYYQSSDLNIETAFENALQKTNEKLHQLIQDGLTNWVDKLNIIIAVIKDNELHLTQLGTMKALLIHGPKIVDILEASQTPAEIEINPLKIFANIVSGQLAEGDYLLCATSSLFDFVSQEKLKRTISGSRPQDAAAYIENLLIDTNQRTTFAALIVHALTEAEAKKTYMPLHLEHSQYSAPQVSMDELQTRERQTSELLTPSLWPAVKKNLLASTDKARAFFNEKVLRQTKEEKSYPEKVRPSQEPKYKEEKEGNLLLRIAMVFWNIIKGIFLLITKGLLGIYNFFKNWKTSRQQLKSFPDKVAVNLATWIEQFRGLPTQRKALLIIAFVLIFGFAQSIVTLGEGQEKEKVTTEYNQIITDIDQKLAEIDATLIYGDDQKALAILNVARDLVGQLPDKKQFQDQIAQFNKSIREKSDKINHINNITEPTEVFDFATAEEGAAVRGITLINGKIYSFNPNNNSIYGYDLETKESDIVTNTTEEIGNLQMKAIPSDNNYIVFYTNSDKIARFALADGSLVEREISFANQDKQVGYLESFAGRLYILDTKNNQIFRHNATATGYASGQSWITEELDLTDATSITIDGNIYVLKADGQIWKLTQGAKDEFTLGQFEPSLSNSTRIYTRSELDNIYVLDPENNRLVILDKKGLLINQYRSDQFDGLKDFVVTDDEATIYLLNKTKLFQISL
ncbi:MAG: hypothetical protein ABIB97_02940 [Patescibacteria group bacterium]